MAGIPRIIKDNTAAIEPISDHTHLFLFTASVVVQGKCQGLMFSDSVSSTPFRQLRRFVPRLRQVFAVRLLGDRPGRALKWGRRCPIP